jgi:hypothetical protein
MNEDKHRLTHARIEGLLDRIFELYEQAEQSILTGKDHHEVIASLNEQLLVLRPLKTVR